MHPMTSRLEQPRLLAFDTSTERLAVAVVAGRQQWCALEDGGPRSSQRVLPLAFELMASAGIEPSTLDAVAFGRGPGAFTGLRTACSVAQGLALGLRRPVLPIDCLALVAEEARARHDVKSLWVTMDARMDEVYAGEYMWRGETWHAVVEPALWTLPALNARWQAAPPVELAGSALAVFGERLAAGTARRLPEIGEGRAEALARLARGAWARGEGIDAADALPLYLRDKVALTTAERAAAAAA
ncbi:MAG: tRNA (adenosine(37)-N6)-threonylcarbamoyltransferase complex dimerization subunit type 1 TsaB [Aquincola sp.]|nr:tRNA (adenosine(37)-N6)-threonylcarbamoyltransferase complex dimerization subunit type 1 TsaB [Aquincola sp.]